MDPEQVDEFVMGYLKKKGFNNGTRFSSIDYHNDPDLTKLIRSFSQSENDPSRYREGYSKLRSWGDNSLDLYKHELLRVIYPVFIHCYINLVGKGHTQEARAFFNSFRKDHEMVHLRDLQKLEGVLAPSHLQEMEFARSLRQSKFNIKICQCSYDLLLQYLHRTESTLMLGIINERINFQVYSGQPNSASDDIESVTISGSFHETADHVNQKEIHWGLLEDRLQKTGGLLSDSEKGQGESKADSKKRSSEIGKQGSSVKKLKKDKAGNATAKVARQETSMALSTTPRVKPELAMPVMSTDVEESILEDLRNRVQLSSLAMPSVSFYTFVNTHNGLNSSSISHDGSLVAGGFSDSSIKVWDMAKIGQAGSCALQDENGGRNYTLLLGHSGPVYSATFSPPGDYVLSSSADTTIRLWSTKLNANLVCYKGHNHTVWDAQFSPFGHYFASFSHDRTARIWTMDRIHPLRMMAGHLSDVDCVQWHPNCNYIATGSSDKTVRLWDVQTGECVRIFVGHRSMVLSLAMSPDGRYMASGDEDGTIMMWELSTARCITPLIGHNSCVWTLSYSGEGSLLASGSADCTVKLWDVSSSTKLTKAEEKNGNSNRLRSLRTFPTKSTPVHALRFSRRNLLFAAGPTSKPAS
ncbi:Transcription initiation factor TFIID subunit 5 [Raphanus sativus]|uniref:Transcription initiation factor TFIID subunit 5 isoform X1 n=2 Tax=Raphanus sativus TaxID=3726 RepID=A0A6J0JD08_RAPSA|nr:transcription initiation factor TFIID subunit 5 isoform X1 [Raphanus sativus]KAJ4887896.1 Transcription initiation factor TFIID subunit 5 [Raphanus sativus]